MPRRPRELPPHDPQPRPEKPEVSVDSMSAPNLNRSHLFGKPENTPYPLLMLLRRDANDNVLGAFIDGRYGDKYVAAYNTSQPPSWMDPHRFERMCLRDEKCVQLRDRLLKEPTKDLQEELIARIEAVFEDRYLVYILRQFETVKEIMAEWLVAKEHYRRTEPAADKSAGQGEDE